MNSIIFFTVLVLSVLTGCINSSTSFSNRGITYQYTPDASSVSQTETTDTNKLNAQKTTELNVNTGAEQEEEVEDTTTTEE